MFLNLIVQRKIIIQIRRLHNQAGVNLNIYWDVTFKDNYYACSLGKRIRNRHIKKNGE